MVIHETATQERLSLMWVETLRFAQGDTTACVILSEAKNPALLAHSWWVANC
jgi:hypothetical protein